MITYERSVERTPNGGDYSEIFYYDDNGEPADKSVATRCDIHEMTNEGKIINTIHGIVNRD